MSNLLNFAKTELAILRGPNPKSDEMQDAIEANVLKMVEVFSEEGHSGSSASYTIGILKKVLAFEPITPLTGGDDEWVQLDYAEDMAAQNKRCPHVFKRADGTAYDSEGYVFEDPDGSRWTNGESRKDITFPYTPAAEVVKRGAAVTEQAAPTAAVPMPLASATVEEIEQAAKSLEILCARDPRHGPIYSELAISLRGIAERRRQS